ncbi:toxin-antitoxin system HicB family antitoxin [Acinetobacter corruptisaponis]|uniref:Toxin-antitoxin system HicB family antitoxin n=1 Tax=Acinetobacter corruptisaponis TaxID=3045147 RepID=A0ABY8S7B9_9GAMM|nr:toxin-antitoxin system HicB family antitoxin [Acinetobacter sp. KCTC 92772]WHP06844.1 toxin-antitoxin system HicB family antitoxin [Acinetobacter sp. KCTC 92772]
MKPEQNKPTDVRFRLEKELHKPLKDLAKKEDRSMNYLMNKAVEFYLNQSKEMKT